jgi:2-aminoadipate transaminase
MTGAMQGLDLIGKILVDPGDPDRGPVPHLPRRAGCLAAAPGQPTKSWTGASNGPDFDATLARAKFVYAVRTGFNPTGALVPQSQRLALLEKVRAAGTWLLEDDPITRSGSKGTRGRTSSNPMPPDWSACEAGHLSGHAVGKSIVPGLQVGWAIAAEDVIKMLALAKQCSDLSSSLFTQAVALELLESGFDREHAAAINAIYRERRDVLCAEAAARIGDWFEWEVPPGGMFVWMRAKDPRIDTNELYKFALEEKVAFVPGSVFDPSGNDRSGMRVNFTRSTPETIAEGVRRLERAIRRYLHR